VSLARSGAIARALLVALITAAIAACGQAGGTFDPSGPCTSDARAPGAYPVLERLLPTDLAGKAPTTVDSGRNCEAATLTTYAAHGVAELRFAGATWDDGGGNATVIAVLATPGDQPLLHQDWIEEFYLAGAKASTKTENIETSRPTIDGTTVYRIETLNDLSLQTVIVWSANGMGAMHVVIVATRVEPDASRAAHDAKVAAALAASKAAPD